MKSKAVTAFLVAMVAMVSCTKNYYVEGTSIHTEEYKIVPNDWQRNTGNLEPGAYNYLYVEKTNSYITRDVMNSGSVQGDVYVVYDNANDLGAWNPLPYVYPIEITQTDESGNQEIVIASETLRMEWEEGKVTFILQDLDGYDPLDLVSSMSIRVSVIY